MPTWGVNDEQSGEAQVLQLPRLPQGACAFGQGIIRNIGRSNLLSDAACLPVLDVCAPHVVQDLGLACRGSRGRVLTAVSQEGQQVHNMLCVACSAEHRCRVSSHTGAQPHAGWPHLISQQQQLH